MYKSSTINGELPATHSTAETRVSLPENLVIFFALFICYLIGGYYLRFVKGYLPLDALSRMVSAWLVTHGSVPKLASIGFIWPPLPTLFLIPLTWIAPLYHSWMVIVVVSAFFMAFTGVMLAQIAGLCGISAWLRRVLVFLFAVNPVIIIYAINGMSESIMMAAILIACFWLIRFWKTKRSALLIFSAGFFGLLPLIRYEFVLISAWSGLLILLLLWEKRHVFTTEKFGQFLEGNLLAYGSLLIYPFFLWLIANWFIMGNPLYFMINNRSNASVAEVQLSDYRIITTPLNSLMITLWAWVGTYPLELIASTLLIFFGLRKKSGFLVGLGLMPALIPFLEFFLLLSRSNVPLIRYYVMVIPLGLVSCLVLLNVISDLKLQIKWHRTASAIAAILLAILSNIRSVVQLNTYPYQNVTAATWNLISNQATQEDAGMTRINQAVEISQLLAKRLPKDSKVLIDTFGSGFAFLIGAKSHEMFMDYSDPDYDAALLDPQSYVEYILLPEPTRGNELYAVNMYQKSLYDGRVTWVEWVDILPQTIDGWKLYKIVQ